MVPAAVTPVVVPCVALLSFNNAIEQLAIANKRVINTMMISVDAAERSVATAAQPGVGRR